ncbi:MAG: PstS family phosphate ABC transporter substrate-binding protein, partial [Bacillota bacterium]
MLKKLGIFIVIASLMVVAFGCSSPADTSDTGSEEPAAESEEPAAESEEASAEDTQKDLSGKVIVDGSGTVYPLMAHIGEEYMVNEESSVSVQVGRAGSSAGFKKFIPGET